MHENIGINFQLEPSPLDTRLSGIFAANAVAPVFLNLNSLFYLLTYR
jgi:hypothetical protein